MRLWSGWYGWCRRFHFAILFGAVFINTAQATSVTRSDGWIVSQQQLNTPVWLLGQAHQAPARVPLGSLWKLWVYSYSLDQHLPDQPYACYAGTQAAEGDEYCCSHSELVSRDMALARSCGAYFQPKRLKIQAKDWQQYWQRQAPLVPWLQDVTNLQPQTAQPVGEILNALNSVPPAIIAKTRAALLGRLIQPQWSDSLPVLGGAYRFKTYTWHHPQVAGAYFGGAAGWLADGTAFWLGGTGGSHAVVQRLSAPLTRQLPPPTPAQTLDDQCVVVHYFNHYPIQRISRVGDTANMPIRNGRLHGDYRVQFVNQQLLGIHAMGELTVQDAAPNQSSEPQIYGRFSVQDYLARVVDREGDASQTQAARALSIAAHSYLLQNAEFHQGCWQIDDDSRTQRVSPNPPSPAARAIVAFTEGLVLGGSPIYYHQTTAKAGSVMSWQNVVSQSQRGVNYMTLLKQAYPQASWQLSNDQQQCQPLAAATQYFQRNLPKVQHVMATTTGFEALNQVNICTLDYGHPYADQQALNIYIRDWRTQNDHVTLWHEYLHLAMRFHPKGQDEHWVESKARQLTDQLELSGTSPAKNSMRKIRYAQ
jgi:uncharacterized protein YfaQ (DUF2300 family)